MKSIAMFYMSSILNDTEISVAFTFKPVSIIQAKIYRFVDVVTQNFFIILKKCDCCGYK